MKPFLYLDNWHIPQPVTRFDVALKASNLDVVRMRTNEGEFPHGTDYCGVYVSPSFDGVYDDKRWIHQEHDVLHNLGEAKVPMLGLCFGSQILASSLCGRDQVFVRNHREKGYGEFRLTEDARTIDPLTQGLPKIVPVFHWHQDEVRTNHPDVQVLGYSEICANQIWRWRKGLVWGIQPHPELNKEQVVNWFVSNQKVFEDGGLSFDNLISRADDNLIAGSLLSNYISVVSTGRC